MRVELDDNTSLVGVVLLVVTLLATVAFNARACSVATNRELTERCKALIEAKADPVTLNTTCGRVTQ